MGGLVVGVMALLGLLHESGVLRWVARKAVSVPTVGEVARRRKKRRG